jgi:PiT family inorganic phosphate transporter
VLKLDAVMIRRLYEWIMDLAAHRHAGWALAIVAFLESSFFPLPPDALLIPMGLANRARAFRYALIAAGAFGAYALGANNIANVIGVFVPLVDKLFRPQHLFALTLDPALQLRLFGGLAIALGIWNSYRVMMTVGRDLARLNALAAWVVVLAQALVLLVFASQRLSAFLTGHGLPPLPLVPVSSSQATVGAVVGLGLLLPGRQVDWGLLGRVVAAWVLAPLWAAVLSLVGLYVLANVFGVPLLP